MIDVEAVEQPRAPGASPLHFRFFSGPCAKPPGWSADKLDTATRSGARIASRSARRVCRRSQRPMREMLGFPTDYRLGIVPASDTGAIEMAIWSMLGASPGDDAGMGELRRRLGDRRRQAIEARPEIRTRRIRPNLPDLSGSTGRTTWSSPGTARPRAFACPMRGWIPDDRDGPRHLRHDLGRCSPNDRLGQDRCRHLQLAKGARRRQGRARHAGAGPARGRTAGKHEPAPAATAQDIPPDQKGQAHRGIFKGETINTPSMLCVEDWLFALGWAEQVGGLPALIARAGANAAALDRWVQSATSIEHLRTIRQSGRTHRSACNSPIEQYVRVEQVSTG